MRSFLQAGAAALLLAGAAMAADTPAFDPVVPGREIRLPEDAGSHPGHRLEWWYVTGHLDSDEGPLGFQVTFFRARNPGAEGRASRFAPTQLLFVHAALAQPSFGRLRHEERNARAGFGLAEARTGGTDVFVDDWSLRFADGAYRTKIPGDTFTLDLAMRPTQSPVLQGERGFSRKGPSTEHASYYYSEPHLEVSGTVLVGTKALKVRGVAWLDHEWSSALLAPDAMGWDWVGLNLDDGASLMAFRMRGRDGNVLWSGGTYRPARGDPVTLGADDVRFTPLRKWRSPRTATDYPVAMEVRAAGQTWKLEPLLDDQELDARGSTGTLYWEGAVRVTGASTGKGYLELTGYREKLPF